MSALEYRDQMIIAKQKFGRGEISIDDLYAAADAYIEAIRQFKKRTNNKKLRVPDRAYVIRAIG